MTAQLKLTDICERNHGGNPASKAAHARAETASAKLRRMILDYLRFMGPTGQTAEELEEYFSLPHQTVSARCSELKKLGAVRTRGYRLTRSGSKAGVLVACEEAAVNFWASGDEK